MQTTKGLERLVFFTDAVTAIAITLLIVPLVDLTTSSARTVSSGQFLRDNSSAVVAFLISFVVISRLWVAHHSMFEHVAAYTPALRTASLIWAFTIAFLPLPTAMASEYQTDAFTIAIYVGTMTMSSVALTSIAFMVRADASLRPAGAPADGHAVVSSVAVTALFALSLLVGVLVPAIGYYALLLLLLQRPARLLTRRVLRLP